MSLRYLTLAVAAAVALSGVPAIPVVAGEATTAETYADIQKTFGVVPEFFKAFPEARLPQLWHDYETVQLGPNTSLDAKTKQLIALAVAASNNCGACVYFQSSAAVANGATGQEIQEAVALSVIGNAWSKILSAGSFDDMVKKDTNTLALMGALKAPATN